MAMMFFASTNAVMAQKATAEKQDQILEMQSNITSKVNELQQTQMEMRTLYGSNLDMTDDITKLSYAYGLSLGENFKSQGIKELDYSALNKGLMDALSNSANPKMTVPEAQQFLNEYISTMMTQQAKAAKEAGEKWLAENAKKDGVKVTESGLQYTIIKEGEGANPSASSKVTVHYHGTLTNGEVFDSSVQRGQPATFGLNQVISGWTEGLQLMKQGAKYKFFIPSELGYGERSPGGSIGPNEVLIFEVELISVDS
jgi:FKBP-type peptidyl-prolyl cis-trans isomerase FklB